MGANSNIEWTTHTFNPWIGCTKVSPGCVHCYAEESTPTRAMGIEWGKGKPRHRTSAGNWAQVVQWNNRAIKHQIAAPSLGEDHHRPRVFCASLADWLDNEVPIEWLADLLDLIRRTPDLDWLLLTKRPQVWQKRMQEAQDFHFDHGDRNVTGWLQDWRKHGIAPANVWLGVSVEDQQRADERIPELLKIPAKVRFLSVEPLLERVDLNVAGAGGRTDTSAIDWVIIGGESGTPRRDCGVEAIESVAQQCVVAGVPVFVKQDCAFKPGQQGRISDATFALKQFPTVTR